MTTSTAGVPAVVAIRFRGSDGPVTVSCEVVDAAWAITPDIRVDGTFTGRFRITHRPTGFGMPMSGCIDCARIAAARFAAIAADWTDPGVMNTLQQREEVKRALHPLVSCDCDGSCAVAH